MKRLYNKLPPSTRAPYAIGVMLPTEARMLASATARGRPGDYIRGWTHAPRARNESLARPPRLGRWIPVRGSDSRRRSSVFAAIADSSCVSFGRAAAELGCNQFVFRRHTEVEVPISSS